MTFKTATFHLLLRGINHEKPHPHAHTRAQAKFATGAYIIVRSSKGKLQGTQVGRETPHPSENAPQSPTHSLVSPEACTKILEALCPKDTGKPPMIGPRDHQLLFKTDNLRGYPTSSSRLSLSRVGPCAQRALNGIDAYPPKR